MGLSPPNSSDTFFFNDMSDRCLRGGKFRFGRDSTNGFAVSTVSCLPPRVSFPKMNKSGERFLPDEFSDQDETPGHRVRGEERGTSCALGLPTRRPVRLSALLAAKRSCRLTSDRSFARFARNRCRLRARLLPLRLPASPALRRHPALLARRSRRLRSSQAYLQMEGARCLREMVRAFLTGVHRIGKRRSKALSDRKLLISL